jgi:hypothetical protein
MEDVGIFYGHILPQFGVFCGNLVHFSPFLVFCTKKTLATLVKTTDVYLKRDYPRHSISG